MKVTEIEVIFPSVLPKEWEQAWVDEARARGFKARPTFVYETIHGNLIVVVNKAFYSVKKEKTAKGTRVFVTPLGVNEFDFVEKGIDAGRTPEESLKKWCSSMKELLVQVKVLKEKPKGEDAIALVEVAGRRYELYVARKSRFACTYARPE